MFNVKVSSSKTNIPVKIRYVCHSNRTIYSPTVKKPEK